MMNQNEALQNPPLPDVDKWVQEACLKKEKDLIGFYLSGDPLEKYQVDFTLTKYSIKPKTEATKTYFESTYTGSSYSIDSITEITYGYGMKNLIYVSGSTLKLGSAAFNSYPTAADNEYTKN